jgi:RNase adaptor protein for sRNA GlmZ degradation
MPLHISLTSFSYRKGIPEDSSENGGGFVFDCRALPNPGREEAYKKKTGLDKEVVDLLGGSMEVSDFLLAVQSVLMISVDNYLERSFTSLTVGFGCTGGQHRSVYCTEKTARWLSQTYAGKVQVSVSHRDMPKF